MENSKKFINIVREEINKSVVLAVYGAGLPTSSFSNGVLI